MTQTREKKRPSWSEMGLTRDEYERIIEILGREPDLTELGMFAVLWSEHCAYKHSRPVLKKFPTSGPRVLVGPGENAGVVDIGEDVAIAIRIESHNHPCAIEPYQGAATGIGGIVRDVLSQGARPVALLDSLRFGPPSDARSRYIFGGVVSGISGYGNCIGVPTVGGEVFFEEAYEQNPLCNVMCVGTIEKARIVRAAAKGIGNPVIYVGAATGRDGIHGATFASAELDEESEEKRPSVQVGDPFMEKLAIEACLELAATDFVVGIQDMGAAGLTSSCAETASRAGNGIEIDISLVPRREEGMTPYEVMLSESQERMLVIARKGSEEEVHRICRKYGIHSAVIGRVTGDGIFRVKDGDDVAAEIPARALTDDAPVCYVESREPEYIKRTRVFDVSTIDEPFNYNDVLMRLLASPNIASKEWVYRQYDFMVRTNTVVWPGADAAVLRVKGTEKGIALSTDCNGRYCYLDPYTGGAIAVAEAARNCVCVGAEPIAITNCLNFGNPERPEIFWQLDRAIEGMAEACRALNTPVTGGNVSLYNETSGQAVYPTPVVGMLGVLEDIGHRRTPGFKAAGDLIVLIGDNRPELGGSEYLKVIHGQVAGVPPEMNLLREKAVQSACLAAIRAGLVKAAHDCADGGLAVALAEMCFAADPGARGARVELPLRFRADALLFGETQSRIIVSVAPGDLEALETMAADHKARIQMIGIVESSDLKITVSSPGGERRTLIEAGIERLERAWREAISCAMK